MEIANDFEGECYCDLRRQLYFEHCFDHVRTDIEVLIKRYEYLKGLVESSCSMENLKSCMECNDFLKSIIENSTQDNQELEENIAALQEVITHTRKYNESLLEEANKQRKRNDSEELARKLVECQEENKKLMSQVAALEQEKSQLEAVASFWCQKGGELSHRYDQQASEIEDIIIKMAVVKQVVARVMELVGDYPAPEKQAESPCKEIMGVFSMTMHVICQFESSIKEKLSGFLRDTDQANSSLETKCWNLEQELKTVSEEKASLAERPVSKMDGAPAKHVELEAKLKTAEAQVKQLQEELQEERRRLSEQITVFEERKKLLDKAKQENVTMQQKNARQFETYQERIKMLERSVKSTLFDSQATKEELTARQDEVEQLVHALEKRNEVIRHLEEEKASLYAERHQHMDRFILLENEIKELNNGFENEIESKVEHIEHLQQEVEKLEKDREQLISICDDLTGEIIEWQAMLVTLCLMIDEVKGSLAKAQEPESELKGKCEELDKIRLELKVLKNKYNSVKREMHELKQKNRCLVKDLSVAEDTITRIDHEINESSFEITTLEHDVKKGRDTIRKQCDTIMELEITIKDLRKILRECSAPTKDQTKSSRIIQEKAYTQVTMEKPPPEVTNEEQSSAEIAQGTAADHLPSGTNLLDDREYRYEKITSELEVKIKITESSHHKEVENLNRVHMENMITLKKALDRERAKERNMYEELLAKQQEMHEEQVNELNKLHDSELSFLRSKKERERFCKETQASEDCTEPLATGAEVFPSQDNGSTDPVTAKETILLIEENSFGMRIKVLKQQNSKELDSLKIEHARKLADITEELKNSLAEEEASLEKQLQALREGNEQELLRLKTRYCSEMKHENEKFNLCRRDVLESVKKALPVSKTEVTEIKPSSVAGSRTMSVARSDTSLVMSSGSIVLNDFQAHTLRRLVHSGSEALSAEQLAALHNLVCPTSCSKRSLSNFSNGMSDLLDEVYFRGCNTESEMDNQCREVVYFELKYNMLSEAEKNISSQTTRTRQAYSNEACSSLPMATDLEFPSRYKRRKDMSGKPQ